MAQTRGRIILPDMNGVVDPLSKVAPVENRSGFAIYFDEDPALTAESRVSFQHKTYRRRTGSGNAFYAVLVVVAIAALVLGFTTGVIDLHAFSIKGGKDGDNWLDQIEGYASDPKYLPIINASLMIFTVVMSLFNFIFLLVLRCMNSISNLQMTAFSILILSIPSCMFVIGIWAATI